MTKGKMQKNSGFLKSSAWIALGGFVAKVLGAIYRIPLTNLIGGHGLGLYQMVYPVYCLLLTVSATGIPSSIAKLTAERVGKGQGDKGLFTTAMKTFFIIGFLGMAVMVGVAPILARAQGTEEILSGYFVLAPSVVFVALISVFRGWFQGKNNMFPTALSEIIEQAVKVSVGILFAYLFRTDIMRAVVFLLLAVTLSEMVALALMYFLFRRVPARNKLKDDGDRVAVKSILKMSIPVTFSSALIPLSTLLDSILAVRLLSYATDGVALYGLFAGGAVTVINLPVSICYGIAAASVPAVATAKAKKKGVRKKIFFALGITALVAVPSAIGLYFFAEPIVKIIYRSLNGEELSTLVKLIKIFSISAVTLSCVQTLSACLTAQGKPQHSALSMSIALTIKTILYATWLKNPSVSIFGLAYATNIGYLVAFFFDLVYNLIVSKKSRKKER